MGRKKLYHYTNNKKLNRFINYNYTKIMNLLIYLMIILTIVLGFIIGYRLTSRNSTLKNINKNIALEYGEELKLTDIVKNNYNRNKVIKVTPLLENIKEVGEHKVKLVVYNEDFNVNVKIVDTTPPTLELKELTVYIDEELPNPNDFVDVLNDLSNVTLEDINIEKMLEYKI